jgi:hypothetical protein
MAPPSSSPKLAELKLHVYALAGVSSTRALKLSHPEFASLDFRRKNSWLKAEEALAQPHGDEQTFEQWLSVPPEEYRELFAEINTASSAYQQGIENLREASRELLSAAEDLECQANAALETEALHCRN